MITSTVYLVAAYGFVIVTILALVGFYIWRNMILSQRLKALEQPIVHQIQEKSSSALLRLLPLLCFVSLVGIVVARLGMDGWQDSVSSSDMMVGRPVPIITLPLLDADDTEKIFSTKDLGQRIMLVNFWASWCAPCRLEHPLLMQLAQDDRFDLIGINYKDDRENALAFLRQFGNPYQRIAADRRGRAAIEWGVLGAPETYVIDSNGMITYRHIGPLTPEVITSKLLPAITAALR